MHWQFRKQPIRRPKRQHIRPPQNGEMMQLRAFDRLIPNSFLHRECPFYTQKGPAKSHEAFLFWEGSTLSPRPNVDVSFGDPAACPQCLGPGFLSRYTSQPLHKWPQTLQERT